MRFLLVPVSLASLSFSVFPAMLDAQEIGSGRMAVRDDQSVPNAQVRESSSSNTRAQARVTVILRDSTIKFAVQEVLRQAKLRLVYNTNSAVLAKRVQVHVVDVPATSALETILRGTGLIAKFGPNGEVMIRSNTDANDVSESIRVGIVSGRVTDSATSRGLAGVTVMVRGANISKTTNGNGEFSLTGVPAGEQTIEFKLVGYRAFSRTVRVNDGETMTVNVVLRPAATMLSEVVTTAVGQQQRRDIGYTVASINVDSVRQVAPIKSVTDLLENRVPGVTVQRTSGSPGDPARIRLRGASSINENNDPVIIVDGSRQYGGQSDPRNTITSANRQYATTSPLDQIDPASIERIDILKGPAASAMYGPDASSGAIVITTKRGQAGPPQWNVGFQAGMSEFPGSWPIVTYQWVTPTLGGFPALCVGFCGEDYIDSVRKFQALNDPYLTPLGRGNSFNPSVSVSGGTGKMTYTVTASSLRERGILKLPQIEEDRFVRYQERPVPGWMRRPDLLERRSATANMETPLNTTGTTTLRLSTNLSQEVQRRTSMTSTGQGVGAARTVIGYLQGLWVDRSQLPQQPLIGNPYERVISPKQTISNSALLSARPVSWLSAQANVNLNSTTLNPSQSVQTGFMPNTGDAFDQSAGRYAAQSLATSGSSASLKLWTVQPVRRVHVRAGVDYYRQRTEDQTGSFVGVPVGVDQPSGGNDSTKFTRKTSESIEFGYYFAPQLIVSERLNISPGFRLDQNGLSGKNAKLIGWPKLDGSWIVSEEPFFPLKGGFITELRLRGGFGIAGNQPTSGDLDRLYATADRNPVLGPDPLYGEMWQITNLGNTRLRPERVRELDMGFDVSVWDNRIQLNVSHSRKFTTDAIVPQTIAGSVLGIKSLKTNIGDLQNQSTEMSLNATPLERKNIGVQFTLNFDRRQSLVKRLARGVAPERPSTPVDPSGEVSYVPGYPIEGIWQYPITGYNDLDNNGWISRSEFVVGRTPVYVGSSEPAYQLSFFPTVTLFKNFMLSAGIAHVSGQVQSLSLQTQENSSGAVTSGPPYANELVFGPEGFNRQVALLSAITSRSGIGFVQKVDQTRLNYVSVSTRVSPSITRLVSARALDVSLRGSNLALWTNYIGVDPNVNGNLSNAGLSDNGQLPAPREWSLNFTLRY